MLPTTNLIKQNSMIDVNNSCCALLGKGGTPSCVILWYFGVLSAVLNGAALLDTAVLICTALFSKVLFVTVPLWAPADVLFNSLRNPPTHTHT